MSFKKRKAPVITYPIRLKLFFEYLNHICNPAFAVHPCPSPIFCHRKISLSFGERPLTSYPGFRPSLHRNGYLQISPSIQIFPHYFCHTATFTGYFRYR